MIHLKKRETLNTAKSCLAKNNKTKSKMTLLMNKKLCYKYMISHFDSGSIALCNNQVLNNVIHKGRVLKNHVQEIIG